MRNVEAPYYIEFLYKDNSSDCNLQRRRVFMILRVTRFSRCFQRILKAKIRKVRSLSDLLLSRPQEFPPELLQRPLFQPRRKNTSAIQDFSFNLWIIDSRNTISFAERESARYISFVDYLIKVTLYIARKYPAGI